jgi:hypothetical protein
MRSNVEVFLKVGFLKRGFFFTNGMTPVKEPNYMTEFIRGHISFSGLLTKLVRLFWLVACVHFRPSLLPCLWER